MKKGFSCSDALIVIKQKTGKCLWIYRRNTWVRQTNWGWNERTKDLHRMEKNRKKGRKEKTQTKCFGVSTKHCLIKIDILFNILGVLILF